MTARRAGARRRADEVAEDGAEREAYGVGDLQRAQGQGDGVQLVGILCGTRLLHRPM